MRGRKNRCKLVKVALSVALTLLAAAPSWAGVTVDEALLSPQSLTASSGNDGRDELQSMLDRVRTPLPAFAQEEHSAPPPKLTDAQIKAIRKQQEEAQRKAPGAPRGIDPEVMKKNGAPDPQSLLAAANGALGLAGLAVLAREFLPRNWVLLTVALGAKLFGLY